MIRTQRSALLAVALLSTSATVIPFAASPKGAGEVPPPPATTETPAPVEAVAVNPEIGTVSEIESGVPVPVKKGGKGGGASPYKDKIEGLQVSQSFHVAGKTKKSLNSTMHTFNKKYRRTEVDASGNPVTELKIGKNKLGQETRKTVNKFIEDRKFEHYDVDATDPRGVGVRVFRVK